MRSVKGFKARGFKKRGRKSTRPVRGRGGYRA